MKIARFEDLMIWKSSLVLTKKIYQLTNKEKFSKDFALRDQIRRAVISISSNVAEGFEKRNNNEFIRFLRIAKGSAGEVKSQIYVAALLEYITVEDSKVLAEELWILCSQIGQMINYLEAFRKNNP